MPSLFSSSNFKPKSLFNNNQQSSSEVLSSHVHMQNESIRSGSINESGVNIVQIIFSLGLFLLPFFILPLTTDVSNLNKSYLVMYLALASLMAYLLHGWKKGSLSVKDFGAYLPSLSLFVGGILSVFFSKNQAVSLYGQTGNYSASFIVLVALVIVSFVSANVELRPGRLLGALIAGTTISTIVAWLGMYNLSIPVIGVLFPGFTLADSFGALLALQLISGLGALYLMLRSRPSYIYALLGASFVLNIAFGLITLDFLFMAILAFGLFYLASTSDVSLKSKQNIVLAVLGATALFSAIHLIPGVASSMGFSRNLQVPRMDITSSWYVTGASLIENPLFGTGLGTYMNSFTRFRPALMNASVFWNATYQYPFNDLFLWLSTAGLIGAAAYLIFVVMVGKKAFNVKKQNRMYLTSFAVIIAILAMILLGGGLAVSMFVFILAGTLFSSHTNSSLNVRSKSVIMFFVVLTLGLIGLLSLRAYRVYAAQIAFRQSLTSANLVDRYQLQRSAIAADPYESFYYREAILTNLATASRLSQSKDLNEEQKTQIQQLLVQAVNDFRVITEMLDPQNSANWEVRGALYRSMISLDKEKNQFSPLAAQSYMNAINTNPTNPRLYVDLGGIYYVNKDYQNAVNYFARAVQLKPDYTNAYYNLAYALKDGGAYEAAVTQLEVVQRLIKADSEDAKKLSKDLEEFKKLAEEAKKKAEAQAKVNVPEVKEPSGDAVKTAASEPITNPAEATSQTQIDPNSNVDVSKIESASKSGETTNTPSATPTKAPASDGSNVDTKAGEKEAPIANPQP